MDYILGGIPSEAGKDSIALLPELFLDPTWAIFEFRRAYVSTIIDLFAEFGSDLTGWTRAIHGSGSVQIITVDEGFGVCVDRVTVRVPITGVAQMFLRLNSNMQEKIN